MAAKYKLTYFNFTGLGEPIRYVLAYGKIDYEDIRIEKDQWINFKPGTPFGKVPLLEVDGKKYCQSIAIARYFAKKIGIQGKSDLDALQADMIVDTITDFRNHYFEARMAKDPSLQAAKMKEIMTELNPFFLERLDKIVADNGGYFVNEQLTWADIIFAATADGLMEYIGQTVFERYSNLKALKDKIDNIPNVKEYRATRPKYS